VFGSQALYPSLCATATRTTSSDNRSPTEAMGGAWSQSPACGDDTAKSLALSVTTMAGRKGPAKNRTIIREKYLPVKYRAERNLEVVADENVVSLKSLARTNVALLLF